MNNEEVKEKEVQEKNEEVKEKNEETQKSSKSFSKTISDIWNSKPIRFVRKVTKWTLITGGALIGVAAAAKTGTEVALEERDAKMNENLPDEIPEETPEIPEIPEDSSEETEE